MSESNSAELFRGYAVRRERWTIAGEPFDFIWPADMDVLLDDPRTHERHRLDGYMPYWGQPWPGAVLLAEALLQGKAGACPGKLAIEIGCGVGVVSVAAARTGWSVVATDYDEDGLAFTRLNAERNGVNLADVRLLDFRNPLSDPAYDLVLAADLLYEHRLCEPVARWIASALKPGGLALLSDPNRTAADTFPDRARSAGLDLTMDSVESHAPAGLLNRGRIWHASQQGDRAAS